MLRDEGAIDVQDGLRPRTAPLTNEIIRSIAAGSNPTRKTGAGDCHGHGAQGALWWQVVDVLQMVTGCSSKATRTI